MNDNERSMWMRIHKMEDEIASIRGDRFFVGEIWTWQDDIKTPLLRGRPIISIDREKRIVTLGDPDGRGN